MRRLLVTLVLSCAALAAAAEDIVFVYNWSDYIDESLLPRFERESRLKLVYDTFDSTDVIEERLLAGASGYDVVAASGLFLARQRRNNVFRPLDKARLPNLRHASPEIMALARRFDPENALGVPYLWGTIGLAYNVAKIRERMPDAPVDSLRMIFDPEVVERFADCGVALVDSPGEAIPAALRYLGLDPDSKDPKTLVRAEPVLQRVRPFIGRFESNVIEELATGEICLALTYSGDTAQAAARAREAKGGHEVAYRIPKEGAGVWFDMLAIPADAENPIQAHRFLDFILQPDVGAKIVAKVGLAGANAAARALLPPALREDPSIHPDAATLARLYAVGPYDPRSEREITRIWIRIKGRN